MRCRLAAGGLLLSAALALAGCDDVSFLSTRRDTDEEIRTLGVVTFASAATVDAQLGAEGSTQRFAVEARFVSYPAAFETDVREVLGLADLDTLPAPDSCTSPARPAGAPGLAGAAPAGPSIELLDVGRILVRGAGTEHELAVRTFPDLLDVMSGVTYGGVSALPFQPGRRYDVRGETDRTPWVSVAAPPGWDDLRIDGIPVHEGFLGVLDPASHLDVRWIPWTDRASDVVLTLSWTGSDREPRTIVCHPRDDGAFELPPDALAVLPTVPDVADLTLRIERAVRVSFPLDRVDEAEAVFRVSLTTPLR